MHRIGTRQAKSVCVQLAPVYLWADSWTVALNISFF